MAAHCCQLRSRNILQVCFVWHVVCDIVVGVVGYGGVRCWVCFGFSVMPACVVAASLYNVVAALPAGFLCLSCAPAVLQSAACPFEPAAAGLMHALYDTFSVVSLRLLLRLKFAHGVILCLVGVLFAVLPAYVDPALVTALAVAAADMPYCSVPGSPEPYVLLCGDYHVT